MVLRPPISTRTDTLFPYTTLFRSRAEAPLAAGHGWFGLQVSSISRAATPESLIFGPSLHQIGPSPSQTLLGVQSQLSPLGTTDASRKAISTGSVSYSAGRTCGASSNWLTISHHNNFGGFERQWPSHV